MSARRRPTAKQSGDAEAGAGQWRLGRLLARLSAARRSGDGLGGFASFGALADSEFRALCSSLPASGGGLLQMLLRPPCDAVAIDAEPAATPPGQRPATYADLAAFLAAFDLARFGVGVGDVCAVVMPNGPELAAAVLAVMAYAICAPVNASNTIEEIQNELSDVGARAVIILDGDSRPVLTAAVRAIGATPIIATPGRNVGMFQMSVAESMQRQPSSKAAANAEGAQTRRPRMNELSSIALLLRTSGSSGRPKLVPSRLEDLVVAACCTAAVLELQPHDVGINILPMFHMGGIHRNLLAPLLSGGSMVYMPFFEPARFWELFRMKKCTWYHGVPSIHTSLVNALLPWGCEALEGAARIHAARTEITGRGISMRFVSNAGAALPHAQAQELKEVYDTVVMPCYGMSECGAVACPSITYNLGKPGSVGQVMGPEVIIRDVGSGMILPCGVVGEVCLQGVPTFPGYMDRESQRVIPLDGVFATGDMGFLDDEGYLYMTGRCKEVINRGGEIISPLEVEEAFLSHPAIWKAAAFSVRHRQLQEAVGIMLVMEPGHPRLSRLQLIQYASSSLSPAKWPVMVVYAERLPLSSAGKLVRIAMAERMGLPDFDSTTSETERHYETIAIPDPKSGNRAPVPTRLVERSILTLQSTAKAVLQEMGVGEVVVIAGDSHGWPQKAVLFAEANAAAVEMSSAQAMMKFLESRMHGYLLPGYCIPIRGEFPRLSTGDVDLKALRMAQAEADATTGHVQLTNLEEMILQIWRDILGEEATECVGAGADFFSLGGTSVQAAAVGFRIRDRFRVSATGALLYERRTIRELAEYIEQRQCGSQTSGLSGTIGRQHGGRHAEMGSKADEAVYFDSLPSAPQYSSASASALLVYGLTIMTLPIFTTFVNWLLLGSITVLGKSLLSVGTHRLTVIVIAVLASRAIMQVWLPFVYIMVKWAVIGRFRSGRHSLWGGYYLRWWIVDQFRRHCGPGIFGSSPLGMRIFYRLLGARVGNRVVIDRSAVISEPDLIVLDNDVIVDPGAHLRPAAADCCDFLLAPISVGEGSSLPKNSTLSPGSVLPAGTCMRPCSSTWEMGAAHPRYRSLCNPSFSGCPPSWRLAPIGWVLIGLPDLAEFLPVALFLYLRMETLQNVDDENGWMGLLDWLIQGKWLALYLGSKFLDRILSPFLRLAAIVSIKKWVFGHECFRQGLLPERGSWGSLGRWWISASLRDGLLCGVAPLINVHSELHSCLLRALGAKVGQRVFWPLSGLVTSNHDLVEIGDDVVWGAHHAIITSDGQFARAVRIESGANPLDRCVLSPGCSVGRNAVVGTGSFVESGESVSAGGVFLGSSLLEASRQRAEGDTMKPYGLAHSGHASYLVIPDALWPALLMPIHGVASLVEKAPFMSALWATEAAFGGTQMRRSHPVWQVLIVLAAFMALFSTLYKLLGLFVDVAAKWAILGRRSAGEHDFHKSPYSQKWHLYLAFQSFSKPALENFPGTCFLPWYFRSLGGKIGKNVCFLEGAAPMLTREPDLTVIGDNTCINNCIIRCHSNSHGRFTLQPCVVGARVTLRSHSIVQGGAVVEDDAVLLEHTLAMPGETVRAATATQGWPSHTIVPARVWSLSYKPIPAATAACEPLLNDRPIAVPALIPLAPLSGPSSPEAGDLRICAINSLRQQIPELSTWRDGRQALLPCMWSPDQGQSHGRE